MTGVLFRFHLAANQSATDFVVFALKKEYNGSISTSGKFSFLLRLMKRGANVSPLYIRVWPITGGIAR